MVVVEGAAPPSHNFNVEGGQSCRVGWCKEPHAGSLFPSTLRLGARGRGGRTKKDRNIIFPSDAEFLPPTVDLAFPSTSAFLLSTPEHGGQPGTVGNAGNVVSKNVMSRTDGIHRRRRF